MTQARFADSVADVESNIAARRRYSDQRQRRTPPHVPLREVRLLLKHHCADGNWDLDDVADRVEEITGDRPRKGTLSAIESGVRGVSVELLAALEQAYEMTPGALTTDYRPRAAAAEQVAS